MTAILQVLDLVVNGPIKEAHIRLKRARRIVDHFKSYKNQYYDELLKPLEVRKRLKFTPLSPTMVQGIKDLFELFAGDFTFTSFAKGIESAFTKTGTVPTPASQGSGDLKFEPYIEEKISGTLKCLPLGTREVTENVSDPDEEDVDVQHANVAGALDAFIDNEDEDNSDSEDEEV